MGLGMLLGIAMAAFYGLGFKPFTIALHNMARAQDVEQCNILVNHLVNRFPFFKPADDNAPSTMYTLPERNALRLYLYGVTNSESQDEIISVIRSWQSTNRSLDKISVRFYGSASGSSQYGERLPKEPLCTVSVELPR